MKTKVCVLSLAVLLVGCAEAQWTQTQPRPRELRKASQTGPADYLYARAHANFDQAAMVRRMTDDLQREVALEKARRRYYVDKAAQAQRQKRIPPAIRDAQYQVYIAEARFLEERIAKLQSEIASLEATYGHLIAGITEQERRGMAVEAGRIPF